MQDYKLQRPSQELIAKDLHGVEWRFRHIYRGQPRRHLLTTGWSIFVNQKNLVSGDAVLFLRSENGELRLGIRRALRPRNGLPSSVIGNQNSYSSILSSVANAISRRSTFDVFYSPGATHAEFVVPYKMYIAGITSPICIGSRFKMRYDMEDAPERRCTGVVTRIGDLDPYRWPKSKWKCLKVQWDDDIMNNHQERVSPWEIEPSGSLSPFSIQHSPRLKKARGGPQMAQPDNLVPGAVGLIDFEESLRSSKVLQGQENLGFTLPLLGVGAMSCPGKINISDNVMEKPTIFPGFVEPTDMFPKVLQGQEVCPLKALSRNPEYCFGSWENPSRGLQDFYFSLGGIPRGSSSNPLITSPLANSPRGTSSIRSPYIACEDDRGRGKFGTEDNPSSIIISSSSREMEGTPNNGSFNGGFSGYKLFGFPLASERPSPSPPPPTPQASEQHFCMEGLLKNPRKGWRVLYTDRESAVMVVGDDPWHEFCEVASKMHIYIQEEAGKMTSGAMISDSYLDQSPVAIEQSNCISLQT
ncbi:hypothetical protein SAY87_001896 [Trapa incisa]|uniref:Auxin response factor n=1 Tax=Trapa incisa TaxID=236973 RepID=A0AAN7JVU8_9MYRT|nr:hypothetical protein SAY87_001896 [Trapa incisa]